MKRGCALVIVVLGVGYLAMGPVESAVARRPAPVGAAGLSPAVMGQQPSGEEELLRLVMENTCERLENVDVRSHCWLVALDQRVSTASALMEQMRPRMLALEDIDQAVIDRDRRIAALEQRVAVLEQTR